MSLTLGKLITLSSSARTARFVTPLRRSPAVFASSSSDTSTSQKASKKKMEELVKNPYFGKYANKVKELQQNDPSELQRRLEENKKRNMASMQNPAQKEQLPSEKFHASAKPVYNKQRQLKDMMKTELLDGKSIEEVAEIWTAYHKGKEGSVAAVVPTKMYETIVQRAAQYPIFLYPLPRDGGYEFFVTGFQGRECFFTQLASFQMRQADSPPCLSVIHFEDYKEKGIVLMRGEYDHKILNPLEVQCLLNQMQLYYGTADQEKIKLVDTFNKNPSSFSYTDLISEVEHSFASLKA
ncbi:hypothetical protein RvY_16763 [Ramazzottius varieornatus]|uniref:ATP synthase mitochondrial F1 complex assembly factor 1 n=1 Tax=Ramazzottius varieornatus TaxID=947166 RepID=A0A1D1VZP0_RAMVA|nr:hypothetical protein RvY_16763 [Ramazzottius varieornatus]